jgi:hypothetical protein
VRLQAGVFFPLSDKNKKGANKFFMKTKKPAKITILCLLTIAFMLPWFSACSTSPASEKSEDNNTRENPANTGDDPGGEPESATKAPHDLPEAGYDGYEFKIMNVEQTAMPWIDVTIVAEEDTGEGINDAVYIRNLMAEERFGIRIKEIKENAQGTISSKANKSIQAGSDDYDLILLNAAEAMNLAKKQLLTDYCGIPYINLSNSYWDKDIKRDLSVGGRCYLMVGDFSMMHYGLNIAMFFNKKLLNDLGLESPYNIINRGNWTYDKFFEMASGSSSDLNGDGKFDKDDRYGYLSITHIWSPSFLASAGQQTVLKDANDMHYFGMDNEKFISVYQKMTSMMHTGNMLFDADDAGDHRLQDVMFPGNQALFWSEVVHWATILRNMDSDFGIIIHPKFDENQTGYWNYVGSPPVMCVPATAADFERTGMILEALCYESTDTVIKAYYDVLLKTKISRDDESEGMLDIMFNNKFYNIADTYYQSEIHSPMNGASLSKKADADIVGWIDKNRGKIEAAIAKTNEALTQ